MKRLFLLILLLVPLAGLAQTQAIPVPFIKPFYVDANGVPYASGTIDFYLSGTSTRKDTCTTYQEATATTCTSANTNPVVLDSAGRANIWLLPFTYRAVLKNAAGSTIWDISGIPGSYGVALSGTATANRLAKFTSTAGAVANSSITDDGSTISTTEPISTTSTIAAQTITGTSDHSQITLSCIAADAFCRLTSGHTASGTDRPLSIIMGTTERISISTGGNVVPLGNATQDFGSTSARWDNGYFDNTVVGLPTNTGDFSYIGADSGGGLTVDVAAGAPRLQFRRAGGSQASRSNVADGNNIGQLLVRSWSGGAYYDTTEIDAEVDGVVTNAQAPPGRLKFYTTPINSTLTLAMTIDSSQRVGIGAAPIANYKLAVTGSGTPIKIVSTTTTSDMTVVNSSTAQAIVRASAISTIDTASLVNQSGVAFTINAAANFGFNTTSFGGTTAGVGGIGIRQATTNPTGTVSNGGVLYSDSATGVLTWLDSAGNLHALY